MTEQLQAGPTLDTLRAQRDRILALAAHYGATNVRVFGSVARGDSAADSDIDLLVHFREGASLYDLSGLRLDLIDLLGFPVDVISDQAIMRERFRSQLLREAVPL